MASVTSAAPAKERMQHTLLHTQHNRKRIAMIRRQFTSGGYKKPHAALTAQPIH